MAGEHDHRWRWVMLFLSFCYLIPELIFNATIVSAAGAGELTGDKMRAVELFGRTMSGIGATLLIADLIIKRGGTRKRLSKLMLTATVVWPIVFYGQKILIDELLVEPSTGIQRQHALASMWVSAAMANDTLIIEGIAHDPNAEQPAKEKAFLTVFGALLYMDDKIIASLGRQREYAVAQYIHNEAMQGFDEAYADYTRLREEVTNQYREYREHKSSYRDSLNSIPEQVSRDERKLERELDRAWRRYQMHSKTARTKLQKIMNYRAPVMIRNLKIYMHGSPHTGWGVGTRDRWDYQNNAFFKMGVFEPEYFLIKKKGPLGTTRYEVSEDVTHYTERMLRHPNAKSKVEAQLGGYPYGIATFNEFKRHPITAKKTREELQSRGLKLPSNWTPYDLNTFRHAASQFAAKEASSQWSKESEGRGSSLPPNLNWQAFQRHPVTQEFIAEEMGDLYHEPIMASWNNKQFLERVVKPSITRSMHDALRALNSPEREYQDGGRYEVQGKDALRAVLVPPIAMGLSLFLAITTAVKLIRATLRLLRQRLFRPNHGILYKTPRTPSFAATVIITILILAVPMSIEGNDYTSKDSPAQYFAGQLKQRAGPVASSALQWVLNAQPRMLDVGGRLEDRLGVFAGFEKVVNQL